MRYEASPKPEPSQEDALSFRWGEGLLNVRLMKLLSSLPIHGNCPCLSVSIQDLPRRAAFSDDLPPPQQQEQWTPTLEQQQKQQKKHRGISGSAAATATSLQDSAQPAEE